MDALPASMTRTAAAVVDLNLVHLCAHGFWECLACGKVTNTVLERDRLDLEEHAICILCGSRQVRHHAAVFEEETR